MKCSTPMESWTIGSNVSFFHLTNRPNRSNRRKGVGPFYNGDIFLSLANEMQHSNGKLDFSNRIYNFTIWQIERKDPMFMTHFPMESIWQYWTTLGSRLPSLLPFWWTLSSRFGQTIGSTPAYTRSCGLRSKDIKIIHALTQAFCNTIKWKLCPSCLYRSFHVRIPGRPGPGLVRF